MNSDKIETEELKEKADKVEKSEDAVTIIKECEEIIRTKKKNNVCITYRQGKEKIQREEKVHQTYIEIKSQI